MSAIPANLKFGQVLAAIRRALAEGVPPERRSTKYCLIYQGQHLPPKYVLTLATALAPYEFSGGTETNTVLRRLGFTIEACNCGGAGGGSQLSQLAGERVTLRLPRERDKQDRLAIGRHAEYVRMVGGDHRHVEPLTQARVELWFERLLTQQFEWVIEVEDRCIGTTRLHSIDERNRRARYAIGIFDPVYWGQGIGKESTRLVLRYAFETLTLHRIDLRVLAYNQRAIACYESCGFVREGVEREGAWIAGQWQDDIIMSILEHEYRERLLPKPNRRARP